MITIEPKMFDDPVRVALSGPQSRWAQRAGRVLRYPPDIAPFTTLPRDVEDADWASASALVSAAAPAFLIGAAAGRLPPSWELLEPVEAALMAPVDRIGRRDDRVRSLTLDDAPAALALTALADLSLFGARTIELGPYVGIERDGVLIAMGGTRLRGRGWAEISSICTAPMARGAGLASAIVRHLAAIIETEGLLPILYVETGNPARHLYEQLGFREIAVQTGAVTAPRPSTSA